MAHSLGLYGGFMVMGLVSCGLWPVILCSVFTGGAKMDASERDSGKWTDTQCLLLPFPELFWLGVAY